MHREGSMTDAISTSEPWDDDLAEVPSGKRFGSTPLRVHDPPEQSSRTGGIQGTGHPKTGGERLQMVWRLRKSQPATGRVDSLPSVSTNGLSMVPSSPKCSSPLERPSLRSPHQLGPPPEPPQAATNPDSRCWIRPPSANPKRVI